MNGGKHEDKKTDLQQVLEQEFAHGTIFISVLSDEGINTIDDVKELSDREWCRIRDRVLPPPISERLDTFRDRMSHRFRVFKDNCSYVVNKCCEGISGEQLKALHSLKDSANTHDPDTKYVVPTTTTGRMDVMVRTPFFLVDGGYNVDRVMVIVPNKRVARKFSEAIKCLATGYEYVMMGVTCTTKDALIHLSHPFHIVTPEVGIDSILRLRNDVFDLVLVDESIDYPSLFLNTVKEKFSASTRIIYF